LVGELPMPKLRDFEAYRNIVKWSPDGLALSTTHGELHLVRISSIPLVTPPRPSPQPVIRSTQGVSIVDVQATDLASDATRDLIYPTTPNSEASLGDSIVTIDPKTASIVAAIPAGIAPRLLNISDDGRWLHFTSGWHTGVPGGTERLRDFD